MTTEETLYIRILVWAYNKQEAGFRWDELQKEFNLSLEQNQWVLKVFCSSIQANDNLIDHLGYSKQQNGDMFVITAKGTSAAIEYLNLKEAERSSKRANKIALAAIAIGIIVGIAQIVVQISLTSSLVKDRSVKKQDMVELVLTKNGCTWDNPKMMDNAAFDNCEMEVADELEKEQNQKFEKYINLLNNFPKDDLHIPNQPYGIEPAIQAITNWYNKISNYVESRCMTEIQTKSGVSGFNGLKASCEISLYQSNIDFLNDRIKSFQDHSTNIEKLIRSGVISDKTMY